MWVSLKAGAATRAQLGGAAGPQPGRKKQEKRLTFSPRFDSIFHNWMVASPQLARGGAMPQMPHNMLTASDFRATRIWVQDVRRHFIFYIFSAD
jgi:hypothetical protein